jgi:hypothetical protein
MLVAISLFEVDGARLAVDLVVGALLPLWLIAVAMMRKIYLAESTRLTTASLDENRSNSQSPSPSTAIQSKQQRSVEPSDVTKSKGDPAIERAA